MIIHHSSDLRLISVIFQLYCCSASLHFHAKFDEIHIQYAIIVIRKVHSLETKTTVIVLSLHQPAILWSMTRVYTNKRKQCKITSSQDSLSFQTTSLSYDCDAISK